MQFGLVEMVNLFATAAKKVRNHFFRVFYSFSYLSLLYSFIPFSSFL